MYQNCAGAIQGGGIPTFVIMESKVHARPEIASAVFWQTLQPRGLDT